MELPLTERQRIELVEQIFLMQGDNKARYEEMSDDALIREFERVWLNHD